MLWQSYFIPGTGVLRNELGITDAATLRDAEYAIAGRRLHQLERGEVQTPRTFDDAHLAAIHQHLFQDCYAWAGQPRYVEVAKDGTVFARVPDEVVGQMWDAQQIHATIPWKELDREGFAQALGAYAARTNYSHPFREGNGRAAKLMYDQLAEDTEFRIDWDRVSPEARSATGSVAARDWTVLPRTTRLIAACSAPGTALTAAAVTASRVACSLVCSCCNVRASSLIAAPRECAAGIPLTQSATGASDPP